MADFIPVVVADHEMWGNLVISWSTGKNFVDGTESDFRLPPGAPFTDNTAVRASIADFNAAVVAAGGTSLEFPSTVAEIVFVRDTDQRRYIRLPQSDMVIAARDKIKNAGNYTLPQFYLANPLNCTDPVAFSTQDKLKLQAERVGDYSISSCM